MAGSLKDLTLKIYKRRRRSWRSWQQHDDLAAVRAQAGLHPGNDKSAYREFEDRLGQVQSPRGAKTALVEAAVAAFPGSFTLVDLERACPGVSRDMVRRVLRAWQSAGKVECLGRGPGAAWQRKGTTRKRG